MKLPAEVRTNALELVQHLKTKLLPATPAQMAAQLTPALALCGAASMSEDDRDEWLTSAMATLLEVPADLLIEGCAAARRKCTHPSQIVPTIFEAIQIELDLRKGKVGRVWGRVQRSDFWDKHNKPEEPVELCKPEDAARIMEQFGYRSKFNPTPLRQPTAEELEQIKREMGE